jgi:protein arginine N-methyltransferase 1
MQLDFTAAKAMSLNNMYVKEIRTADLLGGPKAARAWDEVDFTRGDNPSLRRGAAEWSATEATTIYGLALWWTCTLAPGVELTTSPSAAATHWKQIFLPASAPIELARGERLSAAITSDTRPRVKVNVSWELARVNGRGAARAPQRLDMRKGR